MTTGASPTNAWPRAALASSRLFCGSCTTTNFHGCLLEAEGASLAASRILPSISSGTSWLLYALTLLRFAIISMSSTNTSPLLECAVKKSCLSRLSQIIAHRCFQGISPFRNCECLSSCMLPYTLINYYMHVGDSLSLLEVLRVPRIEGHDHVPSKYLLERRQLYACTNAIV